MTKYINKYMTRFKQSDKTNCSELLMIGKWKHACFCRLLINYTKYCLVSHWKAWKLTQAHPFPGSADPGQPAHHCLVGFIYKEFAVLYWCIILNKYIKNRTGTDSQIVESQSSLLSLTEYEREGMSLAERGEVDDYDIIK